MRRGENTHGLQEKGELGEGRLCIVRLRRVTVSHVSGVVSSGTLSGLSTVKEGRGEITDDKQERVTVEVDEIRSLP